MQLQNVEVGRSPLGSDFSCVTGFIAIETRSACLPYSFHVPADLTPAISESADPWTILMLPLACYFAETLVVEGPLDRVLHDNLLGLRSIWANWYPEFTASAIEAHRLVNVDRALSGRAGPGADAYVGPGAEPQRTISSFSGGVDSQFTFLRHRDGAFGDGSSRIDDLLCIGGFNTRMEDFESMRSTLDRHAGRVGRRLVPVLADIRREHGFETPYSSSLWMQKLAHGAFLAGIVHLFAARYREFIIPATATYGLLYPWGSHPLCDRLLSSSNLQVVHDGASFDRIARTERVAESDDALAILQVCARNGHGDGNCSRCEKCLRTMSTLDLLGARERATSFDWGEYTLHRLSHVLLYDDNAQSYFIRIAEEADRRGRPEIAAAARGSLAFSRRTLLMSSNRISRAALHGVRYARSRFRRAST